MGISGWLPTSHEKNNDEVNPAILHVMSTLFTPY